MASKPCNTDSASESDENDSVNTPPPLAEISEKTSELLSAERASTGVDDGLLAPGHLPAPTHPNYPEGGVEFLGFNPRPRPLQGNTGVDDGLLESGHIPARPNPNFSEGGVESSGFNPRPRPPVPSNPVSDWRIQGNSLMSSSVGCHLQVVPTGSFESTRHSIHWRIQRQLLYQENYCSRNDGLGFVHSQCQPIALHFEFALLGFLSSRQYCFDFTEYCPSGKSMSFIPRILFYRDLSIDCR